MQMKKMKDAMLQRLVLLDSSPLSDHMRVESRSLICQQAYPAEVQKRQARQVMSRMLRQWAAGIKLLQAGLQTTEQSTKPDLSLFESDRNTLKGSTFRSSTGKMSEFGVGFTSHFLRWSNVLHTKLKTGIMQWFDTTCKKPVRPVLLQMPGESTSGSGYAQLAMTRSRPSTSPVDKRSTAPCTNQGPHDVTLTSRGSLRRAASLPPNRKQSTKIQDHGPARLTSARKTAGSIHASTTKSTSLQRTSSDRGKKASVRIHAGLQGSSERKGTAGDVQDSPTHRPASGTYYGLGRFAPATSSPETLGM